MSEGTSGKSSKYWDLSAWDYRFLLVALQLLVFGAAWTIERLIPGFKEASEAAGINWLATTLTEQVFITLSAIIALSVGGQIKTAFSAVRTVGWADAGALFFAALVTLNSLRTGRLEQVLAGTGSFTRLFWFLAVILILASIVCQWIASKQGDEDRNKIGSGESFSAQDDRPVWGVFLLFMGIATFVSAYTNWLSSLDWTPSSETLGAEAPSGLSLWNPLGLNGNWAAAVQFMGFLAVSFVNLGLTYALTWRRRQARAEEELRAMGITADSERRSPAFIDLVLTSLLRFIEFLGIAVPFLLALAALVAAFWGLWHVAQLTYLDADKLCGLEALQAICTPPAEPHWYWPDVPRFGSDGFTLDQLPWYFWAVVAGFGLGLVALVFPWRVPGGRWTGGGVALVSLVLILLLLLLFGRSSCIVCQDYKPWLDDGPCVCEAKCEEALATGKRCSCFGRNAEISGCGCQCENKDLQTDEEGYCRICKDPTKVFNEDTGQCEDPEDPIVLTPVVLPDTYWLCTNPDLAVGAKDDRALCLGTQQEPLPSKFYLERHGDVAQTPAILMTMREGMKEGMAEARNDICSAETVIALGAVSSGGEARNYRNNRELAHLRATTLAGTIRSVCGERAPKVFEFALDRQDCAIQGEADTCAKDEYVDRAITVIVVSGTQARTSTRPELMQVFNAYLSGKHPERPGPLQNVGHSKGFENQAVIVEMNQATSPR